MEHSGLRVFVSVLGIFFSGCLTDGGEIGSSGKNFSSAKAQDVHYEYTENYKV